MDENVLKVFKCIWWEKVMAIWYILLAITRTKYLTENVLHVLETKTGFSLFVKKNTKMCLIEKKYETKEIESNMVKFKKCWLFSQYDRSRLNSNIPNLKCKHFF